MKLTIEKRTLLIIGGFAIITLIIIGAIIYPAIQAIKKANDDTYALRVFLEKKQQRTTRLRSSLKKMREIKLAAIHYPEHIFVHGDELRLITALEMIATQRNISQKIVHSNLDTVTNGKNLTLSLIVSGDYPNIVSYLSEIESLAYFLTIKQLQFTQPVNPTNQNSPDSLTTMNLELTLYVN